MPEDRDFLKPQYSNLEFPIGINDPNSEDRSPGFISFQVIQNERANVGNQERIITVAGRDPIHMYIPNGLTFTDGVGYTNFDLGGLGDLARRASAPGGGNALDELSGYFKGDLTEAGMVAKQFAANGLVSFLPEAIGGLFGGLGGAALGSLVDTSKVTAGIALGTQRAINPNTKALLERVNIRQFTFQFNMIPTSKNEAEMIRAIVETFRTELYPDTVDIGDYPALLRYPNKFRIMVVPNGDTNNKHVVRFKDAFLQSVNTSYNPTSTTYFEDGAPVETVMTLNFIEEGIMTKQDVAGGY